MEDTELQSVAGGKQYNDAELQVALVFNEATILQ